jgi:hypothetical protein
MSPDLDSDALFHARGLQVSKQPLLGTIATPEVLFEGAAEEIQRNNSGSRTRFENHD